MAATTRTTKKPNTILMVDLGMHLDDRQDIAEAFKQEGYTVRFIELDKERFSDIDFSDVAAVDMHGCRGWTLPVLYNGLNFHGHLDELEQKIRETGRAIPVANPPAMYRWIYDKHYLQTMHNRSIATVDTTFIGEKASLLEAIEQSPHEQLVLKPSVGTRAANVVFVDKIADGWFRITEPREIKDSSRPKVRLIPRQRLETFLKDYRQKISGELGGIDILLQQYTPGVEISAVFIGDKPHFIRRTFGDMRVAHEAYGGENTLLEQPPEEVAKLARKIKQALPPELRNTPYLRVDMLYQEGEPPVLLEIEAGAARLFLKESGRLDDYIAMMQKKTLEARISKSCAGAAALAA